MIEKAKKVLIVEDSQYAAKMLKNILNEVDCSLQVYSCQSYKEARETANKENIGIFLVDIILDENKDHDESGLKFVNEIRNTSTYKYSPVIFITSLAEPKMYAYDQLHCYQYIEKPFKAEDVKKVIIEALEMSDRYEGETYVSIRDGGTIVKEKIQNIVYMISKDRKLVIQSTEGTETFYYKTIAEMKKTLLRSDFFQCNRNTIVNRKFIWKIDMGKGEILLRDNYGTIDFGRIYKKRINEEFSDSIKI